MRSINCIPRWINGLYKWRHLHLPFTLWYLNFLKDGDHITPGSHSKGTVPDLCVTLRICVSHDTPTTSRPFNISRWRCSAPEDCSNYPSDFCHRDGFWFSRQFQLWSESIMSSDLARTVSWLESAPLLRCWMVSEPLFQDFSKLVPCPGFCFWLFCLPVLKQESMAVRPRYAFFLSLKASLLECTNGSPQGHAPTSYWPQPLADTSTIHVPNLWDMREPLSEVGLEILLPGVPIKLSLQWWSVSHFTQVPKTYSRRSDETTTMLLINLWPIEYWYHVHLQTMTSSEV